MDSEPESDQGGTHASGSDQTTARRDARSAGQPGRKLVRASRDIAGLVRDIGLIIGVPTLIGVGVSLYDLQEKALQEQIDANKAQADALTAQNAFLKETQYDRAAALLKGQKEVYEADRRSVEKQLDDTKKASDLKVSALEQRLKETATSSQVERDELIKQISSINSTYAQQISDLETQLSQRNKEIRSSDVALNTLGIVAAGGNIETGVITLGISPTDIAALVQSAANAATSSEAKRIEELSKQLALSEDAIRATLLSLGEANVPPDQLSRKLVEVVDRYRALQHRLTDTPTDRAPPEDHR